MNKLTMILALIAFMGWADISAQDDLVMDGMDAILTRQKLTCGTTDEGKTRYGMWEGRGYSRVPGEKDKHLFNVIGINTRHCKVHQDEVRGRGYRSVSREIMMYLDPETGAILDTWENPHTGAEVEVLHVANDPVNMRGISWEKNEEGEMARPLKLRKYGDVTVSSAEIPLFYSNPLGSDYQAYIGGAYHAMEIFNTYYRTADIMNVKNPDLSESSISWSRVAQWLPWMQMGDKTGIMVFNATGESTFDKSKIWPQLLEILNERYPDYLVPPPIDDQRPNETSWTVFEKHMESKEKAKVGSH